MKSINYALALCKRYPHEPNFQETMRAAYADVMRKHFNGDLEKYRDERRARVRGVESCNLSEMSNLLGRKEYKALYREIEITASKLFSDNPEYISLDQVVAAVISFMCGLPATRKAHLWTRSAFGDIHASVGDSSYVYAHTHFSLDNKRNGDSLVKLMKNPSATEIYRNVFTLYFDGSVNAKHVMTSADDRTLVAGHTLWRVQEQDCFYVQRPNMAPVLVLPRSYSFVAYNDQLKLQ
jgi:hypothetical protein